MVKRNKKVERARIEILPEEKDLINRAINLRALKTAVDPRTAATLGVKREFVAEIEELTVPRRV